MRRVKPEHVDPDSARKPTRRHVRTRAEAVDPAVEQPNPQLRDLIGYRLRRLNMLLTQHGKLFSRQALGLTQAQWRVLFELGLHGASNPNQVAELTGLERSHVTQAVRVLAQRRFVTRNADAQDGRRILLALTASGRALLNRGIDAYAERRNLLAQVLSDEERSAFDSALDKLIEAAEGILADHTAAHGERTRL